MERSAVYCMLKPWVVSALAKAFLVAGADVDAVADQSAAVLGRPWRWLRPLAKRYVAATLTNEQLLREHREVVSFLNADRGFLNACLRHRRKLRVVRWLFHSPTPLVFPSAVSWGLPNLPDAGALASWLGIAITDLEWFADLKALGYKRRNSQLRHYWYRVLQKDAGSVRLIEAPKERIKALQQRILGGILELIPVHDAAHGFRKGRSIQTYCAPHVGRQVVLKMDLQDFFPSISGARIQGLFRAIGYPQAVANLLGGLCSNVTPRDVWKDAAWEVRMLHKQPHLPQGAPTSPALANLCAYHMDCRLRGFAEAAGALYTRYADDLAFSGGDEFARCAHRFSVLAAGIVAEEGFAVHHRKTRIMQSSVRQQIAGLVVNERVNVRRSDFDGLKAILTNCAKSGPASQNREGHVDFRAHLLGKVAFVKAIHPQKAKKLEELMGRIVWQN